MPGQHALLSPSSSERWMHCTPSARLCEGMADQGSAYAAEGTEAHALCEYLLLTALGRKAKDPRPELTMYDAEMQEAAEGYMQYVMEQADALTKLGLEPVVYVEQRLDIGKYVPDCKGTSDAVVVGGDTVVVCDFKYGKLPVPATSSQLKIYALGVCELLSCLYDIEHVRTVIYQPRLSRVDTADYTRAELYEWAETVLKPAAKLAYRGEGEYECGDWCRFCLAKPQCRTMAKRQLELAKYDFAEPPLLSPDEIASILNRVDELVSWAGDIKDYALKTALQGVRYEGWKLVEGKSIRRYTDEDAVANAVIQSGKDPYAPREVLGITAMEKMLGKKRFNELLGGYITKPKGKPVLVVQTDKRPEFNSIDDDFKDE